MRKCQEECMHENQEREGEEDIIMGQQPRGKTIEKRCGKCGVNGGCRTRQHKM